MALWLEQLRLDCRKAHDKIRAENGLAPLSDDVNASCRTVVIPEPSAAVEP